MYIIHSIFHNYRPPPFGLRRVGQACLTESGGMEFVVEECCRPPPTPLLPPFVGEGCRPPYPPPPILQGLCPSISPFKRGMGRTYPAVNFYDFNCAKINCRNLSCS